MVSKPRSTRFEFSDKFRWYFAKTKFSQKDFASLIGKSPSALRYWLLGENLPQESQLITIIELLLAHNGFEMGQELEQAQELWELHTTLTPFNTEWFTALLTYRNDPEPSPSTGTTHQKPNDVANPLNPEIVTERGLVIKPKGEGEVIRWKDFQKGKLVLAGQFNTFLTVRLTDAVTMMWQVCQDLDPQCQRIVVKPSSLYDAYFRLEYRSLRFLVIAERNWDRGIRMMLTTENLPQLCVTLTVKAKNGLATELVNRFKQQPGAQTIKIINEW